MTVYHFPERQVDLSDYPPEPMVWLLGLADTACVPLRCDDWRERLGVSSDSWLAHRIPSISESKPELMTFAEYRMSAAGAKHSVTEGLFRFAFETPSTVLCDVGNTTTIVIILSLLLVARFITPKVFRFFSEVGKRLALRSRGEQWVKENTETIDKFGEFAYQLIVHGGLAVYGMCFFLSEKWWERDGLHFTGTKALFTDVPYQPIGPYMAWYYIIQAVYNVDCLCHLLSISFILQIRWPVSSTARHIRKTGLTPVIHYDWQLPLRVKWSKTVRSDFKEMLFHDILTNALVLGSSYCRLTRVGSMVSFIHDVSAVTAKGSRMSNILKWEKATLASFTLMLFVWTATRMYILPFVIFWGSVQNEHEIMARGASPLLFICYHNLFNVGLAGLCLLQAYWFRAYVQSYIRMVKRRIRSVKSKGQ